MILAGSKVNQAGIDIVDSTGESKWLESGIRIQDHFPERVIVYSLSYSTRPHIHYKAWAAQMIHD